MKKQLPKILFIIISLLICSQVIHAQSYQRWINWPEEANHQLTAGEMAEITENLYDGLIKPNQKHRLANGTAFSVPQPNLFLRYIRIAVLSVRPWATSKHDIIDAIRTSDRFMWGNDVNVRVKNNWVSVQNKKATFTNNYSGEGKNVFFLFIDGIPAFKCDCGNPLELMPEYYSYRHEQKSGYDFESDPNRRQQSSQQVQTQTPSEPTVGFVAPKTVSEMMTTKVPEEQTADVFLPKNKYNWKPVIIIGGTAVAIGTGLLIYSLLKKGKTKDPVIPGSPVDPTGPMDPIGP